MLINERSAPKVCYHASPRRFKVGETITGMHTRKKNYQRSISLIYLTTAPEPHYTVSERACEEGWHIYEVQIVGRWALGTMWDEIIAESARVVRYVGTARGISKHKEFKKVSRDLESGKISGTGKRWTDEEIETWQKERKEKKRKFSKVTFKPSARKWLVAALAGKLKK
jgi:hypothetical protein